MAISLASLGSSHIFLLPHRKIDEASRFCTRSELIESKRIRFSSLIQRIIYLILFQNDQSVRYFFKKSTDFAISIRVVTIEVSKKSDWSDINSFDGLLILRRMKRNYFRFSNSSNDEFFDENFKAIFSS